MLFDTSLRALADDVSVRELMRPLAPLLDDATVTELVINQPGRVLTETQTGWHGYDLPELDFQRLMSFAVAIATLTSQEISAQRPILSALLPDGERIQIVVPPVVPAGTVSLTLRRASTREHTLDDYARDGLFDATQWQSPSGLALAMGKLNELDRALVGCLERRDFVEFFRLAVAARKNLAAVGDTGSGKTTLMKTWCQHIPTTERVVTIEDVRELRLRHIENCVHLLYSKGGQGQARVTPADLIASSLRMKPDRVLLAELRGAEAYDFLKLLSTGHAGSITSYHAQNVTVAPERFTLMAKEHPEAATYQDAGLKRLMRLTIDVIAHVEARPVRDEAGRQIGKQWAMTEIDFDPFRKLDIAGV